MCPLVATIINRDLTEEIWSRLTEEDFLCATNSSLWKKSTNFQLFLYVWMSNETLQPSLKEGISLH